MRNDRLAGFKADIEDQTIAIDAQVKCVRPFVMTDRDKGILFEQVIDRDLPFVLDVRIGTADGFLIQNDAGETPLHRSGR